MGLTLNIYPGGVFLTGTRTLSVPGTPLPSGTTAVSTGKSVIRSRRPQVRWCSRICLGAVRNNRHRISSNRASTWCVGRENCIRNASLPSPSGQATKHDLLCFILPSLVWTGGNACTSISARHLSLFFLLMSHWFLYFVSIYYNIHLTDIESEP